MTNQLLRVINNNKINKMNCERCTKYKEIIRRKDIEIEYYRSKYDSLLRSINTNTDSDTDTDSESFDYDHLNLFARLISQEILRELNKNDMELGENKE